MKKNTTERWFVARTRHGLEFGVRRRLDTLGVENYLPTTVQFKTRGKGTKEIPIIPCILFIRATQPAALDLIHHQGVPADYMTDCATRRLMVVPDKQMDDFRRVLDAGDESGGLMGFTLRLGEKVRVVRGPLAGVEGHIVELQGETYVVVSLMGLAYARARIPRTDLQLI